MTKHEIVSEAQWIEARRALLAEEKSWTRERDRLSQRRRALPWVKVEKDYVFEGVDGPLALGELFDGRSQLVIYHFMFGPEWDEGCPGCSLLADQVDGARQHFEHNDVSFVAVSRGPIAKLEAYRKRMGWKFRWVSSAAGDFNFDYHVSFTKEEETKNKVYYNYGMGEFMMDELPGLSVFYKDENGDVFHTYSTYARGLDILVGTYNFLDLVPKGRDENPESTMDWVRRHDEYNA